MALAITASNVADNLINSVTLFIDKDMRNRQDPGAIAIDISYRY